VSDAAAFAIVVTLIAIAAVVLAVLWWMLDRSERRAEERSTREIDATLQLKIHLARSKAQPLQRARRDHIGFEPMRRPRTDPPPPAESYAEPARAGGELDADMVHIVDVGDVPRA
jgi:Flp pilus assembly protein TadB